MINIDMHPDWQKLRDLAENDPQAAVVWAVDCAQAAHHLLPEIALDAAAAVTTNVLECEHPEHADDLKADVESIYSQIRDGGANQVEAYAVDAYNALTDLAPADCSAGEIAMHARAAAYRAAKAIAEGDSGVYRKTMGLFLATLNTYRDENDVEDGDMSTAADHCVPMDLGEI